MDTPRHVTSVVHGIVMEVTFWLIFVAATTTCQPVQTLDEILQSGEYVTIKLLSASFIEQVAYSKAGFA
jgi:hypothetical protein